MFVRFYAIFVIIILSITMTELPVFAIDEAKVVTSAEKIVTNWTELLPKDQTKFSVHVGGHSDKAFWRVRSFTHVFVTYDVQKTDSIVSPYMLIVHIGSHTLDNDFSPKANAIKNTYKSSGLGGELRGFKTEQDALSNTKYDDFCRKDIVIFVNSGPDFSVYYLYRGSFWEYKGLKGGKLGGYISSCQEEVFGGDVKGPDGHLIESSESDSFSELLKNIPIN